MNWYEHHIKDYAAAVMYHSWDQDMAYSRMLRLYYRKEEPLPGDPAEVCRLIGAVTPEQKAAVEVILRDFFTLEADGRYHNEKCDQVIDAYLAGEPERQQKKVNEDTRLSRHRQERSDLFAKLNAIGQHLPWNIGMRELRAAVAALPVAGGVSGGAPADGQSPSVATAPATPATQPATPSATPATATHPPPTTHHSPTVISVPSVPLATTPVATGDGSPDLPGMPDPPKPKRTRKPVAEKEPTDTAKVWRAYALAYEQVYDEPPPHSARAMGQIGHMIAKMPAADAPHVAAFYLRDPSYRGKLHPVDLLVRDAAGLHTRWRLSQRGLPDPATLAPQHRRPMSRAEEVVATHLPGIAASNAPRRQSFANFDQEPTDAVPKLSRS